MFKVTPFTIYSSGEPDAKKVKQDEGEEDYSLADITEGSVTSVRFWACGDHNSPKAMIEFCKKQFQTKHFTTCLNVHTIKVPPF